uniref:Uncharacterized protein n=1 Tax=Ascaris lumbricoides TaxID=6252 RepID=A0A0M3HLJ5_ASCLU
MFRSGAIHTGNGTIYRKLLLGTKYLLGTFSRSNTT